jgi:type IV pilus assembly protein PilA
MQQMLENLRARREDDERGFTLIELMVVVLIIAILIAIAIPTFLGAKTRAQDKAAQSSLRNALTNAKGIYTDTDSYVGSLAALPTAEPSLQFQAAASSGPKMVSVDDSPTLPVGTPVGSGIVMGAESASGVCFWIADVATGPGSMFAKDDTAATCDAGTAPTLPATPPAPAHATANNTWAQAW